MRKHTPEESKKAFKNYTQNLYSGRQLMMKHNLNEYASWHIRGEDPNCDFGGPHHQPDLGYFLGTLEECIKYAVDLPSFWTWGGGGRITKAEPVIASAEAEAVAGFLTDGVKEKALAKLTEEEKAALGLLK